MKAGPGTSPAWPPCWSAPIKRAEPVSAFHALYITFQSPYDDGQILFACWIKARGRGSGWSVHSRHTPPFPGHGYSLSLKSSTKVDAECCETIRVSSLGI